MLDTRSRSEFLALIGTRSATWDQRMKPEVGEAALALGCRKPAHIGEYLLLDACAALLASMLNRAGLELRVAAEIVRQRWDDWLTLLIRVEHFHAEQFVCVAWPSADRSTPPHIVMGDSDYISKICPPSETAQYMISMSFLLRCLRGNAAKAGIQLPERLTADPNDKPAYKKWRDEIDAYREAAGARVAKVKPLTPA
jgi:hypothetical protein